MKIFTALVLLMAMSLFVTTAKALVSYGLLLYCRTIVYTSIYYSQPLSHSRTIVITPNNLRAVANYLDDNVNIDTNVIRVTTGASNEKLIEIPLASAGELDPEATIRLTVGFDSDQYTTSTRIRVGIYDGDYFNQFQIYGTSSSYVCRPYSYTSSEGNTANEGGSYYPGEVTMLFQPFYKYGSCATGHDGGFVNVGKFSSTVDLSKGVSLQVTRYSSSDQYRIYYFVAEIL